MIMPSEKKPEWTETVTETLEGLKSNKESFLNHHRK
jgi:hypothetical protein